MKKRIVLLYLGRKGAGAVYSYQMAKALCEKGNRLLIIISCYIENKEVWNQLSMCFQNISISFMETYETNCGFLGSLFKYKQRAKIVNLIKEFSPNCIYVPMLSLLDSFIVDKLTFVENKIVTIHDVDQHLGEKNYIIQFLYDRTVKYANKIVVLSSRFKKKVSRKYHFKESQIIHIPHANFDYYSTKTPNFDTIHYRILFFGRIHEYKGLDVLLESFNIIRNNGLDLKLTIAGSGTLSRYERELIQKQSGNIELIQDWIDDNEVERIFDKCDFVVLSYKEASQSGVIPLAYSLGRSVLSSNVGGLSEQIVVGTFPMVEKCDAESFATAIMKIYDFPDKIQCANKKAYKYSCVAMTWDKSAERLMSIL